MDAERPHICHLTVLNPAVHTRIFYKLARSQQALGWRVSIMGQDPAGQPYQQEGIEIVPLRPFHRLSLRRLLAPWRILWHCLWHRADAYVVHTPELLWVAWLLGLLQGSSWAYDVHEDYHLNMAHAPHYPAWLRRPAARLLRRYERWLAGRAAAVSYAEWCYDNILGVAAPKKFVLRNSFTPVAVQGQARLQPPPGPYLLYSGTLAPAWGIWEALALWEQLRRHRPLKMVVAGFSQHAALVKRMQQWVAERNLQADFFLFGGNSYLPYVEVLHLLRHAYASLALYQLTPFVKGKIPTKFYEALACQKPLIFTRDPFWEELNAKWKLGVAWTPRLGAERVLQQLDQWHAADWRAGEEVYSWKTDEQQLGKMMELLR